MRPPDALCSVPAVFDRPVSSYKTIFLSVIVVVLCSVPLLSQQHGAVHGPYSPVSTREYYVDRVLIGSDGVLVGLETAGAESSLSRNRLIVHLPRTDADSLCVSIRSVDGRYEGIFQFAARRMQRGPVLLDVNSGDYSRERATYAPERLAVHASLGSTCSAGAATTVVAARTLAEPTSLRLSLNVDAGMLVRAELASTAASVRCPLVDERNPYAFNRTCAIPVPSSGSYELRLILRLPGQAPRRLTFPVEVP